ncbi:MAG TPA: NADH-quinone oxidoreductase subunit M [Candidatus Polarisedimenticolia bacterium]|nr:NADH-quinone oxidoreductase subunit M [Candidatus Polarisedimenticolia bacterium]
MHWYMSHILTVVTFVPLFGALLLLLVPRERKEVFIYGSTALAGLDFLLSIPLWTRFDTSAEGYQFVERASWIPSIGVQYFLGIDGISMLLILLTTFLGFLSILSSWTAITERVKEYYIFMLVLQTGMLGVFVSLDFFLFYVFWEAMLVPMYFLIGIWGGPRKLYAAIKFFLYTLLGSVLMLLGILALYFYFPKAGGAPMGTFDITELIRVLGPLRDPAWLEMQRWIFLAFFVGFAIKVPMFPFHTWLPDAHVEAPTAGSVILAGVLLKMGTYGFVRFALPLLPDATRYYLPWMLALSVVGILYGALVAMVQKDWKKLVAYSSVSHLGFCMLGIFALNYRGLTGSVLQMINHGLSTGALFLLVGLVYERRHTRLLSEFGGLSKQMPVFATLFMIITMSSIGLPALNGFIGEFTILAGAWDIPGGYGFRLPWLGNLFIGGKFWVVAAVFGIVLGAAYMLWLYQRTMFGPLDNPENRKLKDLNAREVATLLPIVACCFWIGLYPKPFFDILDKPVTAIVQRLQAAPEGIATADAGAPDADGAARVAGAPTGEAVLSPTGGTSGR